MIAVIPWLVFLGTFLGGGSPSLGHRLLTSLSASGDGKRGAWQRKGQRELTYNPDLGDTSDLSLPTSCSAIRLQPRGGRRWCLHWAWLYWRVEVIKLWRLHWLRHWENKHQLTTQYTTWIFWSIPGFFTIGAWLIARDFPFPLAIPVFLDLLDWAPDLLAPTIS